MSKNWESVFDERAIRLGPINMERSEYNVYQDQWNRPADRDYYRHTVLRGVISENKLNQAFFSVQNIETIQHAIQYGVWKMSGEKYKIGPQNETELIIIMHAIYLQAGKNNCDNIKGQVQELNNLVTYESVVKILSQIEQYIGYLRDSSQNYVPNEHPINVSSAGTKQLRSVTTTF